MSGIFGDSGQEISGEEARAELFDPYRMVISDGNTQHWLVRRQDPLYKEITDEAGGYLKAITEGKLQRSKTGEDWGSISLKRGFILEFRADLGPDLLKWLTGASKVSGDVPTVQKIMIKPDSVDESVTEIYVLSSNGDVGSYTAYNVERSHTMDEMLSPYINDNGGTYRNYTSILDSKLNSVVDMSPDVLYIARAPLFWPYYQLHATVPARIERDSGLDVILLGSEKDRYLRYDQEGLIQFSTTENIYKVYNDGYLSYKYLAGASPSDKGGIGEALMTAYQFINRIDKLTNMKAEVYLSEVKDQSQDSYRFSFDYRLNDMPVYFNWKTNDGGMPATSAAITIDASAKRVLQCQWILRDFSQGDKKTYNDRFLEAASEQSYTAHEVTDISIGYYLDSTGQGTFDPSFIIQEKGAGDVKAFTLPAGKGG